MKDEEYKLRGWVILLVYMQRVRRKTMQYEELIQRPRLQGIVGLL